MLSCSGIRTNPVYAQTHSPAVLLCILQLKGPCIQDRELQARSSHRASQNDFLLNMLDMKCWRNHTWCGCVYTHLQYTTLVAFVSYNGHDNTDIHVSMCVCNVAGSPAIIEHASASTACNVWNVNKHNWTKYAQHSKRSCDVSACFWSSKSPLFQTSNAYWNLPATRRAPFRTVTESCIAGTYHKNAFLRSAFHRSQQI